MAVKAPACHTTPRHMHSCAHTDTNHAAQAVTQNECCNITMKMLQYWLVEETSQLTTASSRPAKDVTRKSSSIGVP